ncbi:AraC family transcriptional regulator [Pseudomonas oryzihabitans]|uniref:AraC family transcriptional regulator n=1 Tax=Pseudomonas oryzihabitans TaxID=47885 RepID=UPI0011A3B02F|nr:AraC family transcriptional regulator [Pseudomonas oryzihabitans]
MTQDVTPSESGERFRQTRLFCSSSLQFLVADRDAACQGVSKVFKPHELKPVQRGEVVSASLHHISRGRLSLNRLEYGTDVDIDPQCLQDFYLVQIPLTGGADIHCGAVDFQSSPQVAALLSPELPVRMRWYGGAAQLVLRLERADLEHHCAQHLPQQGRLPQFDPRLDLGQAGGAYFLQLLGLLMDGLADPAHPIHQPLVLKQFESSLLNALLYGQPHSLHRQLEGTRERNVSPYFIKRIEAYIAEHLHEPLSVETLAEHGGVSVRTLFAGFRTYRGTTPMHYLRDLRLERVNEELRSGRVESVTDTAYKWGFAHLGRFAQEYKRRYGESPSETRRFRGALSG